MKLFNDFISKHETPFVYKNNSYSALKYTPEQIKKIKEIYGVDFPKIRKDEGFIKYTFKGEI